MDFLKREVSCATWGSVCLCLPIWTCCKQYRLPGPCSRNRNTMHPMAKILRTWTFWVRTEFRQEAEDYLEAGRLQKMRAAAGNRRVTALFRERQDGTTVVVVMSIWDSMESIRAFVRRDHDQPCIAQAELARIFDSDDKVGHYSLVDANALDLLPPEWRQEIE
ncbi:MAG: hypothetical protein EOO28_33320 [Comamonadaceae bacterium]|nr:MAG: hypothetical protein EOO28_33320 [Comamonadaceae bacterium]